MTDPNPPAATQVRQFRDHHRWTIPDDTPEKTRRFHPPEDILDRLRARYTETPVPPCNVCGGELTVQSLGGGAATVYAHSAPEGVALRDWFDHYERSRWTQTRSGDSEVIALLDLVESLTTEPNQVESSDRMTPAEQRDVRAAFERDKWAGKWDSLPTAIDRLLGDRAALHLAMHHAYRPEVVAEIAVNLSDHDSWDHLAAWCGGRIDTSQDPSGEHHSVLVLPNGDVGGEGSWLVLTHDGEFRIRYEVAAPTITSSGPNPDTCTEAASG